MIVCLVLWAGCLVEWEIVSTFALANEQECFRFSVCGCAGQGGRRFFFEILWERKLFVPLQNQRQKAGVTEEVIDIMNKGIAPFSDFGAMRTNK